MPSMMAVKIKSRLTNLTTPAMDRLFKDSCKSNLPFKEIFLPKRKKKNVANDMNPKPPI